MKSSLGLVADFHRAFTHPIAPSLTPSTPQLRRLRVELIAEELKELASALGVPIVVNVGAVESCEKDDLKCNMIEAADALADIEYVTLGAYLVFGIPGRAVLAEVHRANMSKLGLDGKPIYREDHKVLKGPNYTPPDIGNVMNARAHINLASRLFDDPHYAVTRRQVAKACVDHGYTASVKLPDTQMGAAILAHAEGTDAEQI